jgi:hypothetical protein
MRRLLLLLLLLLLQLPAAQDFDPAQWRRRKRLI